MRSNFDVKVGRIFTERASRSRRRKRQVSAPGRTTSSPQGEDFFVQGEVRRRKLYILYCERASRSRRRKRQVSAHPAGRSPAHRAKIFSFRAKCGKRSCIVILRARLTQPAAKKTSLSTRPDDLQPTGRRFFRSERSAAKEAVYSILRLSLTMPWAKRASPVNHSFRSSPCTSSADRSDEACRRGRDRCGRAS